jgi:hypothetical protein
MRRRRAVHHEALAQCGLEVRRHSEVAEPVVPLGGAAEQRERIAAREQDVAAEVASEMALAVLAYNLTRAMNIIGSKPPMPRPRGLREADLAPQGLGSGETVPDPP